MTKPSSQPLIVRKSLTTQDEEASIVFHLKFPSVLHSAYQEQMCVAVSSNFGNECHRSMFNTTKSYRHYGEARQEF